MPGSTKQEDFSKVWNHFVVKKNPPSKESPNTFCRYRGNDGLRCAIGILLPDELYSPRMEGRGVVGLLKLGKELEAWIRSHNVHLLVALQNAHDNAAEVAVRGKVDFHKSLEKRLRMVATMFECEIPAGSDDDGK